MGVFRMRSLALAALAVAKASQLPKALLINLPRHPERYNEVKQQLEGAGIQYERAEAVDGKMLSKSDLQQNVTIAARMLLTKGMIGCFLSHRNCWQRCVDYANGPVLGVLPRARTLFL